MALKKEVRQDNGVVTNYHRILENSETEPYKVAVTYEKEYEENMTVEEAYEYLKTLPEFEGAEDI